MHLRTMPRNPPTGAPPLALCAILTALALAAASCSSCDQKPPTTQADAGHTKTDPQADFLQQKLKLQQQSAAKNDGERLGYYTFGQAKNRTIAINDLKNKPAEPEPPTSAEAKAPKRPGIKAPEDTPGGSIDQSAITTIFRREQGSLQSCYERGLKKNPDLKGKVKFTITISTDGKVSRVGIGSDTLRDDVVIKCMTSRVKTWIFPKPEGGSVTVAKTFVFAPQG